MSTAFHIFADICGHDGVPVAKNVEQSSTAPYNSY
jgi:hypothetical protein